MEKLVVISHSSQDVELSEKVCELLESHNIGCWISERDIHPGASYPEEITRAIGNCKIVLLIASIAMNSSDHIKNEIELAVDNKKIILPFKIDDVSYDYDYQYYLKRKHWIVALPNPDDYFGTLIESIQFLLKSNSVNVDTGNNLKLIEIAEKNKKKLIEKTFEKRMSFGQSLLNEDYEDISHFYSKIKRYDFIDYEKNMFISYRWVTIENKSDSPTTFIIHKESGENKINFNDMKIRVKSVDDNVKLNVDNLINVQPNIRQVFKIYFPKPLMPNESMTIYYRLFWPGELSAYCKDELTTSISLTRYSLGVKELQFGVMCNKPTYGYELEVIDSNYIMEVDNVIPNKITADDEPELKALHGRGFEGVYYYIDDAIDTASYRIHYKEKDEIKFDVDEEDF